MSFTAPLWLGVAGATALGVLIAHLFSTSMPPRQVLPTVRFVPQGAPMAVLRTRRLTDLALLALRLLAVALLGLALAGAHVPRSGPPRVMVVDVSRASSAASLDVARRPGDATIVVFDSAARMVDASALDTLEPSAGRGSLSAGLVAAHRAISHVSTGRDEIELVIVSPVAREEVDSATARLIALWEAPVRIERIPAATAPPAAAFEIRAMGDDPVAAALSRVPKRAEETGVRIVRDAPTAADSAWAREAGNVLVVWPANLAATSPLERRSAADTAGGFSDGRHVVVGEFARTHQPRAGTPVMRWTDGEPAASETVIGAGCLREVAIPVDAVGDLALRESFGGVLRSLLEPCGGARDFAAVPDSLLLPTRKPASAAVATLPDSRLPTLLALLALAALAAEQFLRRRPRSAT